MNEEMWVTVNEEALSIDEYKQVLISDGFSEEQAMVKITPHLILRINPQQVYRVTKTKSRSIMNGFSLRCQVTVYVWREVSTGENLEIDHAAAPYVQMIGHSASSSFEGGIEATTTTKK